MLDTALERSTTVRFLSSLPNQIEAALEESRLRELSDTITSYVRSSFCYRWLTAEPDPDIIVIDLRETYTVGSFIRLLDAVIDELETGYTNSQAEYTISRITTAIQAQPIRLLGIVGLACVPLSLLTLTLAGSISTTLFAVHLITIALSAAALRSTHSLADLLESRPAKLLIAALEPPEPPETNQPPTDQKPTNEATAENQTDPLEETESAKTMAEGIETAGEQSRRR
ncbi:hypothetical protein [Natrinema hispanicum]|uniref:Uncharacterized protein n=1 Tax=Natrinema hispanicum TaxID=392421 RepID=A0A1I0F012_9EURY|nr:hypothetical protein [Natrinema hispanicum]SET50719.1 hypothetical protein SAMN04488694_107174 [Natrinema hispanicum]